MAIPVPDATLTSSQPPLPPLLVDGRRLRAQRIGRTLRLWVPAAVVILLLAMCFLLPLVISLPSSTNGNILDAGDPPFSPGHWLGTDAVGVDVFSQLVSGGQVAFEVSFAVTGIGLVVGGLLGVTAGYFGGWADAILSRVLDILIAFPALVLALAIAEGLGPNEFHEILALCVFSIPSFGRLARGATLVIRDHPYMVAARLSGTGGWRVIARHVLPNILPGIVTFSLLGVGVIVILDGALDYLGWGIQPPTASWGRMIYNGYQVMTAQPEYVIIPSLTLVILVVALNLLGDELRQRWGVQ
jgi:peptide/nickel transport system permease protein